MSRLLSRVVLAMTVVPIGTMLYLFSFILFQRTIHEFYAFAWSGVVAAVFVASAWLAIWRNSVRWTAWRKAGTLLLGPLSIAAAAGLGAIGSTRIGGPSEFLVAFAGSTLGILFWLSSTALLWKETAAERLQRAAQTSGEAVFCPKCGYNLTGLHEATCPECGSRFTLNQLYAAQQREAMADAEEGRGDTVTQ